MRTSHEASGTSPVQPSARSPTPLRILFVMTNPVYVRNFESTLRLLDDRGHVVTVAFELDKQGDDAQTELIDRMCAELDGLSYCRTPRLDADRRHRIARRMRLARDYLRYLEPPLDRAAKLRRRTVGVAPAWVERLVTSLLSRARPLRRLLDGALRTVERRVRNPRAAAFVAGQAPDVLLVTPLTQFGSAQPDLVRAAQRRGVATALCVFSWDNLTTKALLHAIPDVIAAWNEDQRGEAVQLHGVPADRVVVTGAPAYDHWFQSRPRAGRADFCRKAGLEDDRPYLLYVCSSAFIAPDETAFVRRWIATLRACEGELSRAAVLVRPHPYNAAQWRGADLSDLGGVSVFPRAGAEPRDQSSRADYHDSIFHSAAVVGLNTSALIESAIVGRGVHTLLTAEFRATQEDTLHFQQLVSAHGGVLHAAETVEAHVLALTAALRDPLRDRARNRRFLAEFVRPHGLGVPATPCLVEAIERAAYARASVPS